MAKAEQRSAHPSPAQGRRWPLALTPAGAYFLILTLFVYVATVTSGINLLYLASGLMFGAFILSGFIASWSLRRLSITRDFSDHIIAGEPADIVYTFTSDKRYWPTVAMRFREVCDALSQPPSGFVLHLPTGKDQAVTVTSELVARRRGLIKLSTIEVSTTFPFGLFRRTRRLQAPQDMLVYPRIGILNRHLALEYRESIESGAMTSNRRGGADEFYGVREYRPGDNIRAIHWRSSARRGELMIREMAANAPPQLILVLNLRQWKKRSPVDLDAVERAIELAASLICYGFLENFAVGLAIAGLPGVVSTPSPQMGRDARGRLLRQLALIDVTQIKPEEGIEFPNRIAGRAEWIIVTLHADDVTRDLLPPGNPAHRDVVGGHRTLLAVDAPDAGTWVRFLSPEETLRILRQRGEHGADPAPAAGGSDPVKAPAPVAKATT